MAFSSITDPGLASLDYASRYTPVGPDLRGGDPTAFRVSESERAMSEARSDEYVQGIQNLRSARAAARDPSSAAAFVLDYNKSVGMIASLAMSDPDKAVKEYDRLESGIAKYRSQILDLASLQGRDPLSQTLAATATQMSTYAHRERSIQLENGRTTTIGYMLGQEGRAIGRATSRLRSAGFSSPVVDAYNGDDQFRHDIANVFAGPSLAQATPNPKADSLRFQRDEAAVFALAKSADLEGTFGKDGTLHLLRGISELQGTAGGIRDLIDTFGRYGAARKGDRKDADGYRLAADVLEAYKTLTTDMFEHDGRERALSDSEKRFAALATMTAMDSLKGVNIPVNSAPVRRSMRKVASIFARSRAFGGDLFKTIEGMNGSPATQMAQYIAAAAQGLQPDGVVEAVDRFQQHLDGFIRGAVSSVPVSSMDTGDQGFYDASTAALRRQSSSNQADEAARALAGATYRALLPGIVKDGDVSTAVDLLKDDDQAWPAFFGSVMRAFETTMSLKGAGGRGAAALLAEKYISALTKDQGSFCVEQTVADLLFSKEGLAAVATDAGRHSAVSALKDWYRRGVADNARYSDQTAKLYSHLRSKYGGSLSHDAATARIADIRRIADERMQANEPNPLSVFDNELSRGTYFVIDPKLVVDETTRLPRDLKKGKDMPPSLENGTAVFSLVQDEPFPETFRTNRTAFYKQQEIYEKLAAQQARNFEKKRGEMAKAGGSVRD